MSESTPTRRTVLKTGGALALGVLAGCTTSTAGTDATTESSGDHDDEGDHGEEGHHEDDTETAEDGHHDGGAGGTDHHDDNTHHEETTHEDEHDHEHGALPEEPKASVNVGMKTTDSGTHFDPHVVWIETGGTVTFELESGSHTATAYHEAYDKPHRVPEGAEPFDSGTVSEEGATYEHTFETEGVHDYYCIPHEGVGMLATVVVGTPDGHDEPGLTPPGDEFSETAAEKIQSLNDKAKKIIEKQGESTEHDDDHDDDHGDETTTENH